MVTLVCNEFDVVTNERVLAMSRVVTTAVRHQDWLQSAVSVLVCDCKRTCVPEEIRRRWVMRVDCR
jgi:hypothetical protein